MKKILACVMWILGSFLVVAIGLLSISGEAEDGGGAKCEGGIRTTNYKAGCPEDKKTGGPDQAADESCGKPSEHTFENGKDFVMIAVPEKGFATGGIKKGCTFEMEEYPGKKFKACDTCPACNEDHHIDISAGCTGLENKSDFDKSGSGPGGGGAGGGVAGGIKGKLGAQSGTSLKDCGHVKNLQCDDGGGTFAKQNRSPASAQ